MPRSHMQFLAYQNKLLPTEKSKAGREVDLYPGQNLPCAGLGEKRGVYTAGLIQDTN